MKTFFIAFLLIILIFSAVIPVHGQGDNPPSLPESTNQDIRFSHLTTDDGLSNKGVFAIIQDQAGFLWIGTVDGLNRYDGYDFAVYKPDYEDPNSIGDRYVRALLVEKVDNIWIATRLEGLNRFDPVTQTFSHYKHDPDDPKSLTPGPVFSLYEDRSGIIWVRTEQGLNSIDPTSGEITHYLHNPDDPNSISHTTVWTIRSSLVMQFCFLRLDIGSCCFRA